MIDYEAIRTIARKDNEEYPDKMSFDDFEVENEAAVQFSKSAVQAYVPHLMKGKMSLEEALVYSCLAGLRMGMLIARELSETPPDVVPEEWSE